MSLTLDRRRTSDGAVGAPTRAVTRSLLACGVLAGPVYVTTSLAQVFTHDGFDLTRHAWSLLEAGPYGWVQSANLILTGAMVVAFAIGLARSGAGRWAPRLVAVFGFGTIAAGFLTADPMDGYPVGVPAPSSPTWHGIGHMIAGSTAFWAMVVAALLLGRTYARAGRRGFAWWCRLTGVFFLAAIAALGSGTTSPVLVIAFTVGVAAVYALVAGVAVDRYRSV